jgi:methylmalonyl-CoA mutase N-terminal domain/subunit
MAYAFGIANAYIDEVVRRGYSAEEFVGRFSFNLNIFGNLWEQVAKFRAGRKVWAWNLKEKYGVKNPRNLWLRGLFAGGGSGLTKAEPENNIIRGAYYALAAALSGAQTTALCSFDEAFTIPTPRSALLSLRTCQILMEEVGMRDTVDPLAGSYFLETLTKEMEEKIREEMEDIEKRGGMLQCVKEGYVQRKVSRQAFEFESALQRGELIKVGVNKYVTEAEQEVELHEYNEAWAEEKIRDLRELRLTRDSKASAATLKALEQGAREGTNVMPLLVDCCRAYATVGEMSDVFRDVFGEFKEPSIF